ncbi:hypothetical protein [Paraburkholderia nodosa]|uniref:hypothetical protein n=1 Tax=Paraburkholderia nodosa TaxID=392320 RepID=UPI0004877CD3|nr:hypothetical protein [Paraburkholderia nodosa]
MSTFQFVQVEGALALPHIRPLAHLPASFGREWALTPPHFSLRAELRALYAAIMHTVCLSAEAFRAAVGWGDDHRPASQPPRPVAAPVAATAGHPAHARSTPDASPNRTPKHTSPFEQRKLAGGAVAIGGAALLAWIVASHAPHDSASASGNATLRPNASTLQDTSQRLADARSQHASAARLVQREAPSNERAVERNGSQRVAERGANPRRDVSTFAPNREARPVTSHRPHGAYPQAQGYSPRPTGANPADEYASILAYAKTYVPARASNSPAVPVNGTEWVNHVSQRRITEVPDRFTKSLADPAAVAR